ncbi:hypothetical protein GobsT_09520 [Gemmata obscuriglobus]|uniref:HEAT repeat domain-containing protein n=1 Tax=Gemmata obscuriglobus TaxID=114 RepID=A0A2Z3HC28_9BACT|nr:hypothetical protein [Gemmata obscuriglobus]AWM40535.1 hypothetical protein C1280_28500 [Gemmata obscuriglobus]QEG26213.1 hypothetical protein GobsT_09520 [Gemmata obscuriglobus]VTS00928.1 unnamed protein product [Gemmata obscuriglobus UQM 2246]
MSFDSDEEPPVRRRSRLWSVAVVFLLVAAGVALWVWLRADPYFINRPDMKASKALLDTARNRPLTDEEFEQALALLTTPTKAAQLAAIATVQADVARVPARRERAIAALERCQEGAPPEIARAAAQAVARLKEPPPPAPAP